ncbi:MAG: maltooligosyltrehalose trehalohydrolase [Solirubrobacteraceae bacterium]|nr:maltooligosyltrehalose trehalohydrolase [Solirubrobacteraceae bacterium]
MSSGAHERAASDAYPWERPLGARLIGDGLAEFRVWAPRAEAITLRLGGEDHPLRDAGYGVYETIAGAGHGTEYRFVIDGSELPDP